MDSSLVVPSTAPNQHLRAEDVSQDLLSSEHPLPATKDQWAREPGQQPHTRVPLGQNKT